ncbi:hypothetical protein EMIT0373P_20708 [Pseudomonas chlororaphis]|nr:hypothetical protein C4K20_1778 [Pseudomonas chlororaphis subsp. aurantiaca]AZD72149.1 hypothetical protein C4K16_1778 [Pseudomonas chlororaphis subsp. aurantiaca]
MIVLEGRTISFMSGSGLFCQRHAASASRAHKLNKNIKINISFRIYKVPSQAH